MADTLYQKTKEATNFVQSKTRDGIKVGVVLGSGLGAFADRLESPEKIDYHDIPHFPRATVEGHAGRLVIGHVDGVPVAVMQGRFHYYEGYAMEDVTFPIRVLGLLGVKSLILTNAAGGINAQFRPGSLMLIADHINLMGINPLRGKNDDRFGPRFPDMTYVYSRHYRELARREAAALGHPLEEGVYAALCGPTFETPAEIRMLRAMGADAAGMSTVPEAIVARQMGLEVLGVSLISNMAAGMLDQPLTHEEVFEMGERMGGVITRLLRRIIPHLVKPSSDQAVGEGPGERGSRREG